MCYIQGGGTKVRLVWLCQNGWRTYIADRVEMVREAAAFNASKESQFRKEKYDVGSSDRTLEVGEFVLCKIPGMRGSLQDSWEGPFRVGKMCNRVNYNVNEVHGKQREKVIHLNNAKRYVERETDVCALTVVADDQKLDQSSLVLHVEDCEGFKDSDLQEVLGEYKDILTDKPGMTSVVKMDIRLEPGTKVIS